MKIPKVIHRLWLNPPGPPMPAEYRRYGEMWRDLHPGWTLIDWTTLTGLYPLDNQAVFDEATGKDLHRYRADIVRLEVMERFGGVYVDADIEPLRAIDDLIDDETCILAESANRRSNGGGIVSNSFLAAAPGHPFFAECVRRIPESAEKYRGKHTAVIVGPYHMDRVLASRDWEGVKILEPWVFYPQSIAERKAGKALDLSRAYGWHKWAHSRGGAHGAHATSTR